jgi:hypothetical protein
MKAARSTLLDIMTAPATATSPPHTFLSGL